MNIKEQIQSDFIAAFKAKDADAKRALSSIKAKFQEAEKKTGTEVLTIEEYMKVLQNMVKQREQSIAEFTKAQRDDLIASEQVEINIINRYLPKRFTEDEVFAAVDNIGNDLGIGLTNNAGMKSVGIFVGEFNKRYPGMSDGKAITEAVKRYLEL